MWTEYTKVSPDCICLATFLILLWGCERKASSDTSPTSYGEIETVGSTSDGQPKSGRGFYDASSDDDDRPLDSLKDTQREVQEDAEEAKEEAGNRFGRFKANIQAATGDLQGDLGQLDVEVHHCAQQQMPNAAGDQYFACAAGTFGKCG